MSSRSVNRNAVAFVVNASTQKLHIDPTIYDYVANGQEASPKIL